jgi:hypothetical protein
MKKIDIAEIEVQPNTATFEDKKTGVKSVGYTFKFPCGTNGFIVITKLKKMPWEVIEDIKKITIEFQNYEDTTT